ncbi:gliding motility lipoprotein GldH [Pedobacter sp. ASV12]|uniref:gliding motility lipoprotein GldH n=1 Tax=Pedobacter sp. ASV12 TaxID=2795120 RepID=UPI0018EC9397|nr:gliding motility lipoprotein GldH [Pedobacter sp. ASV12]
MNKLNSVFLFLVALIMFSGCMNNEVLDVNQSVADNSWAYAKSLKATLEVKAANQPYQIRFRLRHTTDYRYANLYVVVHLKGSGLQKSTRYQFKLAKADGEWLGQGSGAIYTHTFPLFSNLRFPKAGKYEIEIEQNMRDNPLLGISDVGLSISKQQ